MVADHSFYSTHASIAQFCILLEVGRRHEKRLTPSLSEEGVLTSSTSDMERKHDRLRSEPAEALSGFPPFLVFWRLDLSSLCAGPEEHEMLFHDALTYPEQLVRTDQLDTL